VLENPWLFTVFFLGGIFTFFAVLVGVFFLWLRRRRRAFDEELQLQVARESEPDIQLRNLENQIEKLIAVNNELNERLKWIESQLSGLLAQGGKSNRKTTLEEQVYRAFDRGQPITELARQFGRNKGEIELMLNLRRMRREGE
jgi:hypothetical protein